jgi:hypothetical protein
MNEFQAAYDLSRSEQTSHLVSVPAGLFAVVIEGIAYCPFTDATLPHPHRSILSLHGSRRVAEYHANKLRVQGERDEDYETNFVVFPKVALPRQAARVLIDNDEIPF